MALSEDNKTWVETVDNIATMEPKMNDSEGVFIEKTDEEKRLVRKIDLFLMPTIWVLYCFSYMVCRVRRSNVYLPLKRAGC